MFRKAFTAAIIVLTALTLTGCSSAVRSSDISGKGFVYEKGGFPDRFGIQLYEDGSFTYYAGSFSSYVGYGDWELDKDTLILKEGADQKGYSKVFRFKVNGDSLRFIAEGSDNFMYVKVSDGEKFKADELHGFPF